MGWLALAITIIGLLYEFGGHEPIENERMACYIKVARTNVFAFFLFLLPVYIFWSVLIGNIDIRRWHLIRTIMRVAVALPRNFSICLFLFIGLAVPLGWNYAMNASIETGVSVEYLQYLWNVILSFTNCG
jgi:hypothetical protein